MQRLLCALLFLSCTALAAPALANDAAEKHATVLELIEATNSQALGTQMADALLSQLKAVFPTVPDALWKELSASLSSDEYAALVVPIYEKHFTTEELKALLAFYRSDAGRKFVSEMPLVLQEAMQVGRAWGQQKAAEIVRKLQEKGYQPSEA